MLRILLQYLLPMLAPFLVYFAYARLARGYARAGCTTRPGRILPRRRLVVMAISLVTGLLPGRRQGEVWVPPRFEDGRVVPSTTSCRAPGSP